MLRCKMSTQGGLGISGCYTFTFILGLFGFNGFFYLFPWFHLSLGLAGTNGINSVSFLYFPRPERLKLCILWLGKRGINHLFSSVLGRGENSCDSPAGCKIAQTVWPCLIFLSQFSHSTRPGICLASYYPVTVLYILLIWVKSNATKFTWHVTFIQSETNVAETKVGFCFILFFTRTAITTFKRFTTHDTISTFTTFIRK